jgi:hypothetical protein
MRGIIKSTLYVRVQPNRFLVRHIESGREASTVSSQPFTTQRLLIGEFLLAEKALRDAMNQVGHGNSYLAAPTIVIHPLAMVEGGLAPVEHRVFMEVADCAGAKK